MYADTGPDTQLCPADTQTYPQRAVSNSLSLVDRDNLSLHALRLLRRCSRDKHILLHGISCHGSKQVTAHLR